MLALGAVLPPYLAKATNRIEHPISDFSGSQQRKNTCMLRGSKV